MEVLYLCPVNRDIYGVYFAAFLQVFKHTQTHTHTKTYIHGGEEFIVLESLK